MKKNLLSAFFLSILCFFTIKAQVSQEEFDALVDLYNATDGDNWTDNSNWDINATPDDVTSDWYGLSVHSDGYITSVNLMNNNLTGTIPESITDLYHLSALDLYNNNLSGPLPENIFVFSRYLQRIYLQNNQLSGSIPTRIYNVSQFRLLSLGSNNLTGTIPKELGVLRYITNIDLYDNNLSGEIPPELGNISTLTCLKLYGNQLTGSIPSELGALSNLYMLYLHDNQLSGYIPSEFQALTALTYFRIYGNQLTGIPNLTALPLTLFWIENNEFTFADLETNISKLSGVHISPQAKVGEEEYSYIEIGANKTLSVSVDGSHNTYQWYKDDVAISGATSSSYSISNFQLADEGVYHCKIKNTVVTALTIESNYVGLSNTTTPIIVEQPETISGICPDETATFSIEQRYGVSYQWQKKSPTGSWVNISTETDWTGATTNSISSVKADIQYLDGYSYRCVVTNPNGSATSIAVEINIDEINPTLEVQDFTLYLDSYGNATLAASDVVTSASDNCSVVDTTLSQTTFDCSNRSESVSVNVTLSDANGNETTKQVSITVLDTISPILYVKDATLYLDENGSATLSNSDIGNGSADNCQTAYAILSQKDFDCSHLDTPVAVNLSLFDISGNSTTKQAYVTVLDTVKPNLVVEDITLQLDETGNASLSKTDVVTSATDNCSLADTTLSQTEFSCSDIGTPVIVNITLTDGSGNETIKQVTVTIEDNIAPELSVQDLTLQLDANGEASITVADVVTSASDNCSLADTTLSQTVFDCSDIGTPVTVDVTLQDASGNEVTEQVTITIDDNVPPVLSLQDYTVQLDDNGNASLSASDVIIIASDNCSLSDTAISQTTFDCSDVDSPVVIEITLTDAIGNEVTEQATITIADNIAPVLSVQDVTLQLDESDNATLLITDVVTGATDNCSLADTSLGQSTFSSSDVGVQTIDIILTDVSGNQVTEQINVTVNASTTGIDTDFARGSIAIYPNPAKESIQISRNGITIESISIIDYSGRVVLHEQGKTMDDKIDISNLKPEIYIVKIKTDSTYKTYKLIKE